MGRRLLCIAVLGILVSVFSAGCSTKKKPKGPGADGFNESGLAQEGSLEKYKEGRDLGPGGGPLKDINFGFDSFELDDEARAVLRENGNWLKDHTATKAEVEGHCDERGTVEYNLALGAKRARAAKDYLVALGVSTERLTTISYGEELPLCTEHDEECWQRNRRGHFVVIGE